jgi:hypothetical protein
MSIESLATVDTSTLIEQYTEAATKHGRATEAGNYRMVNQNADKLTAIYRELRRRGQVALEQLIPLLQHPEPGVRCNAGADALEFAPEHGVKALEELSNMSGSVVAFTARVALREWRKGNRRPP